MPTAVAQVSGVLPLRRGFAASADESDNAISAADALSFQGACAAPVAMIEGLSSEPFPDAVRLKLMGPVTSTDVEIRPDGTIYLPEIKYRRVLNHAIGPGGWVLIPRGPPAFYKDTVFREFALYCFGKFTAQAIGEQQLVERGMTTVTAIESAKSNALMRCCKDIGVASELWDPEFINGWKQKFAVQVWAEHAQTGRKQKLWRKVDRDISYPWKETGIVSEQQRVDFQPSSSTSRESVSASSSSAGPALLESFDPNSAIPPSLKKLAGRTWADALTEQSSLEYLRWVVKNTNSGHARAAASAALDWWDSANPKTPQ